MIPQQTPVKNHWGNNSATQFDFDFYIENEDQLLVTHTDLNGNITTLEYDVDYTITAFKQQDGSNINFPKAGSSYGVLAWDTSTDKKELLSISLNIPIEQPAEYNTSGDLNKKNLEYSFDYLTRLVQLLSRKIDRAVKVGEGSNIDTDQLVLNINTAIEHLSNIDTVAEDRDNIDAVAANKSNIDTVSGSIANVNNVGNSISNVNTVSTNISNVNTVKDSISNVNTVAGSISNVNTVGNNISKVNTVSADISNVNIVAGDKTNIDTVATNINNVNTVKNSINNVNTVAGDIANVNTVAGDKTNIDTVAADKNNVDTVATNISNVNTVSSSISNVNTVAGHISNVDTVAGIDSDVVDVAANESNINTVATNIEDVQNASSLIKNVYSLLCGGDASSTFTEGVSGGDATSTFTTRISGGNARTVGSIVGDIQSNIRVIELNQRNDEADIAALRADLTTETNERTSGDTALQNQIDSIDDEIILINQFADGLDDRVTTNEGNITEAFRQIQSNDDDIAAIQLVDAGQTEDISALQTDVGILQNETGQVYSVLKGGKASSTFTDIVSGGDATSTFTKRVSGGNANSVGSLLADAYNLIRILTSKLLEAFDEISELKNRTSDLSGEIDAINSITRISGGTATSVFS